MKLDVSYNVAGQGQARQIMVPDECPVCRKLVVFKFCNSSYNPTKGEVNIILDCTNPECHSFITAIYSSHLGKDEPLRVDPPALLPQLFSQTIQGVSPDFVNIYCQALEARARGLSEIAGPGFRKAFEFLIKDYAKSLAHPDQHEAIEKTFAGGVVENSIAHPRIQEMAKRALWLGNDETHYLRKWQDHDIEDLIRLIEQLSEEIEFIENLMASTSDSSSLSILRRLLIRSIFSFLEATVSMLKNGALLWDKGNLSEGDIAIIKKQTYSLTDSGDVNSRNAYFSLRSSFRFAFAVATKAASVDFSLNLEDGGWQAFLDAIPVRNRITHPKKIHDLVVSDKELQKARAAYKWVLDQAERLMAGILLS